MSGFRGSVRTEIARNGEANPSPSKGPPGGGSTPSHHTHALAFCACLRRQCYAVTITPIGLAQPDEQACLVSFMSPSVHDGLAGGQARQQFLLLKALGLAMWFYAHYRP